MIRLGLLGYPLNHSLSPKIHAAALFALGMEGEYTLHPIAPEDRAALQKTLARVRAGQILGLNVTIPHKQNIIPLLDDLTETAQRIGAVNTISLKNGRLVGDNTDAPGFFSALTHFLGDSPPAQRNALVLGAGGSARAVVYALLHAGWNVTLAARRAEQAQQLANSFTQQAIRATDFFHLSSLSLHPSLLVNTTPLGMTPHTETSPWPDALPFPAGAAVYDLVYNPLETRLVCVARGAGLRASTGLGMLIEQAALSFEIWTGRNPPREALWRAVG